MVIGPTWFPDYAKSCFDGLLLLKNITGEGIYFIKYPEGWDEEIEGLLRHFFTIKGSFVRAKDPSSIAGDFDEDFTDFISGISFETGPAKFTFSIGSDSNTGVKIDLLRDEKEFKIENPSHQTIMQSIRVAHILLQKSVNLVCFQMDASCLDNKTTEVIHRIYSYLDDKLKDTGKNLIVFYSDPSNDFTEECLWKSNCYKSFAIIDPEISYEVLDYNDAKEKIKEAVKIGNCKRLDIFLGAGACIESGLPSGRTMLLKALQEFTNNYDTENEEELLKEARRLDKLDMLPHDDAKVSLEHIMTQLQKSGADNLTQTKVLRDFENKHSKAIEQPSRGYKLLKEIARNEVNILAVTTNFDQLLEKNLPDPKIIILPSEFEHANAHSIVKGDQGHVVVKLHGCRSSPNTLGIQTHNVQELPSEKKGFIKAYLRDAREEGTLVDIFFIGYNFADPDILDALTSDISSLRIRPIIVNPKMTLTIKSFMDKFENQPGRATYIPFKFDFFMETIYDIFQHK